ncbi:molybdenum cofactor biosynthesis protein MoaE [Sulfuriferula multivorans]|uniref:Molybdopterin synthase catalytic subunit n=1 Tax=Sulfuriferula multivorans TaxID=1559896 RepID=A0A401JYP0_9PROT|nr:molybdopterin synthase catalytic subunit MoaE [Sulfuriferula multivorans]GCB02032.1 molybdenum cofactor biosynthesis protein MoaE [Sulfuriferula multivorans]
MKILVDDKDFDAGAEITALRAGNPQVGAVASFVGLVRDSNAGSNVDSMTLEHYPAMTQRALGAIVAKAGQRWALLDVTVIHRVGELHPGDQIVLVAVASSHRADAFAACEFIMDYLKTQAPFWKKEQTPEGPRWVEQRATDEQAAARWTE